MPDRMCIRSFEGKPLAVKLPAYRISEPPRPRIQAAKYLEPAGLPPGDYSLRVTAKDLIAGASSPSTSTFTSVL